MRNRHHILQDAETTVRQALTSLPADTLHSRLAALATVLNDPAPSPRLTKSERDGLNRLYTLLEDALREHERQASMRAFQQAN